jgi:hypothetical protein
MPFSKKGKHENACLFPRAVGMRANAGMPFSKGGGEKRGMG